MIRIAYMLCEVSVKSGYIMKGFLKKKKTQRKKETNKPRNTYELLNYKT